MISEIGLAWSTRLEEALNVRSLLKERVIQSYTVYSALVCLRGLCRIFAYRTRYTQCVARLFLRVAYVGSLLIERGIHSV